MKSEDWVEVADDAWYRRYEPWDVNVGVIAGADGLCVVDTRGSRRQGDELVADLARFGKPVRAVINTHWHFDHVWGNASLRRAGAELLGHTSVPDTMRRWFEDVRDSLSFADPGVAAELAEVECTPPDRLIDPVERVDLGDREVVAEFMGRGHTHGDVVVSSLASGAVYAGDLIEQAGPPAYGDDSHPLHWPDTVSRMLDRVPAGASVVPGHGVAVDRRFCERQHDDLRLVASVFRELHEAGVSKRDALDEGADRLPFAPDHLREALLRAWTELDV